MQFFTLLRAAATNKNYRRTGRLTRASFVDGPLPAAAGRIVDLRPWSRFVTEHDPPRNRSDDNGLINHRDKENGVVFEVPCIHPSFRFPSSIEIFLNFNIDPSKF